MNRLIYFVGIFIFVSCGGLKIDRTIDDGQADVLENETLNRYSHNKLNNIDTSNILHKGLILCYQNKVDKGLRLLKQHAIKEKQNSDYWQKIASCYYLDQNYPKANFYNSIALKTANKKQRAGIYNNLGLIYLHNNHYEQAKQSFIKSLQINRKLKTPQFNLAHLYIKFGLYDLAIKKLVNLSKQAPNDFEVIKAIAIAYTQKGNFKKALAGFNKIPNEIRKRADMAVYYAQSLYLAGKLEKAKSVLFKQQQTMIPELRSMHNQLVDAIDKELKELKRSKKINYKD